MYQVSSAFKAAMKSPVQEHRLTGTIGNQSFSEDNIVEGSFTINNQSTDTSDVVLGACYVGQLTAEFTGINIAYGNWINKTITPTFALNLGDNTWESVPLGIYKIKEAKHTDHGVQVTAYDNMIKFDKKFRKTHYMNLAGMWNIISQICTDAGVTLGMTQAQIEALPNGDRTGINIYGSTGKKAEFANDITTLRDLLFWVAQTLGCFATINRAGQLEFRQYTQNVVDVIASTDRIEGATFADYITHYVGIYVENLDDNMEDYYGHDVTALQQELTETQAEITEDDGQIADLQADLVEWKRKLDNQECTQEEYDTAVAEINAQIKALQKEVKQLSKRITWLQLAIAQSGDDGSDMVLGANPLTMAKNLTTRDQQRREILTALDNISYTPFNASVICGAHYDLGDVIQWSGGLYNSETDSFGCVMSWNYTHDGGTELEGYGVDPAIPVIRTKQQKSTDRAQRNTYESARSTVGMVDPSNPDTSDDSVPGKNGDTYIQQVSKTVRKNVSKTFAGFETYHISTNNLVYYTYDNFTLKSDSGNFVAAFIPGSVQWQGEPLTWCVAGSKSRKFGTVYFIVKVPKDDSPPQFEASISDFSEHNFPPPSPFEDTHLVGWGNPSGTANSFNYLPTSDGYKQLNDAGTHYYYFATVGGSGTWIGGLRDEVSAPDYTFADITALREALKADQITIPELYDGTDGTRQYYNDGTGGDSAWKKVSVVTGVDDSDNAGGTENNGLNLDQDTQFLSLKKNVVRAWYKADPPQIDRNFSQLCVRYTGSPDKQVQIVQSANHTWHNVKVTKDDDSVYKIICNGSYNSESINYVVYAISGLVPGKTYYFNFKCNFSNRATFNYDMSVGCGLVFNDTGVLSTTSYSGDEDTYDAATGYYAFRRRTEGWYADFGVTATASTMYMCVLMQAETSSATFTMSELVISQKERQLIRNIYLYDYTAKEWLKYKPFTGSVSGGDDGGSVVAIEPTLSQGTKIADFSIDGNSGSLYAPDYELPIASDETLGGIKVGQNLNIEEDGTLNAVGGSLSELSDVTISSLANDQTLRYNSTLQKWVNADTGKNLFIGTANPNNSVGSDGDMYVKRSEYVSPAYSYFKLVMLKNRSNPGYTNLGEITLLKDDDTEITWSNYDATITTTSAAVNASEGIDKVIDGSLSTYYTTRANPTSESPIEIVITTETPVDLSDYTRYGWYTAAQLSARDMVSWEFYVSKDGETWELMDTVSDYSVTTDRSTLAYQSVLDVESTPLSIADIYIKINGAWIKANQTGGTSAIEDLTDVDLTNLSNGQILKYNSTSQKWENSADTGGADAVEITWAAYQALTAEQKADPTKVYYVTDYPTPSGIDLGDIDDVDLSSPADGQVLKYDATNDKWINANESGGASAISNLTDVSLSNLANGQILKYNSTTQRWENQNEGGGGYILPTASDSILGGVKIGNTLAIDANGALNIKSFGFVEFSDEGYNVSWDSATDGMTVNISLEKIVHYYDQTQGQSWYIDYRPCLLIFQAVEVALMNGSSQWADSEEMVAVNVYEARDSSLDSNYINVKIALHKLYDENDHYVDGVNFYLKYIYIGTPIDSRDS